jgi:hypothetical protein
VSVAEMAIKIGFWSKHTGSSVSVGCTHMIGGDSIGGKADLIVSI